VALFIVFNGIFVKVTTTNKMYTVGYKGTIVSVPKGKEKIFFSEGGKFDRDFKCFYFLSSLVKTMHFQCKALASTNI
jgi:hypothetical protein